jgi:hypothetical protein
VEVPDVFKSVAEPAKESSKIEHATSASALEELHADCHSFEPISSQIEISSTEQEPEEDRDQQPEEEEEEPFFPPLTKSFLKPCTPPTLSLLSKEEPNFLHISQRTLH